MLDLLLVLTTATMQDAPNSTPEATAPEAATTTDTAMATGWWVTTADATEVRSGASKANYPFLRVPAGTPFNVTGDAFGFAQVTATGPAFNGATGWLRITPSTKDRFTRTSDGTGTVQGRAAVLATNINEMDLAENFRSLCILDAGDTVHVFETIPLGGGASVWKIALPAQATGWIDQGALRPATAEEIARWTAPTLPAALTGAPTSPLSNWSKWSTDRATLATTKAQTTAQHTAMQSALQRQADDEAAAIAAAEAEAQAKADAEAAALLAEQNYVNERLEALEALVLATAVDKLDARAAMRLVESYEQIAQQEANSHPDLAHLAEFRANQIRLVAELRADRDRLSGLQAQVRQSTTDLSAEASSLDTITDYVIQGRLAVSLIFDGQEKPIMYRIEDPLSGRSLGYLEPDASLDLSSLLGHQIGVVGTMQFDRDWNVTVVQPERVDLVSVTP